jgi:23S rRNA pseudouridine2605 synthase
MIKERLNKVISRSGYSSRRKADELIESGKVNVNGIPAKIGTIIDTDTDVVTIGEKAIETPKHFEYYAFYKPKGIITSLSDAQGESIKKCLPQGSSLYPVGRLDKDTEGLLILTNDGDFANEITHPSFNKQKIYHLEFDGKPSLIGKEGIIRRFTQGIMFHGKKYFVDSAKFIGNSKIEITIHEGKSRQLRIIAGKIGLEVKSLKRVAIGKLKLSRLHISPGKMVRIKIEDVI